jgi:hypothetical protein
VTRPDDPAVEQLDTIHADGLRVELVQVYPRVRRPLEPADALELAEAMERAA